ncbi:T0073709 isoform 1, partial [Pan troglodytes]
APSAEGCCRRTPPLFDHNKGRILTQQDPKAFVVLQPLWPLPLPVLLECLGGFDPVTVISVAGSRSRSFLDNPPHDWKTTKKPSSFFAVWIQTPGAQACTWAAAPCTWPDIWNMEPRCLGVRELPSRICM